MSPTPKPRWLRIGTDEAGKGDYFGDLVIAGVLVDAEIEEALAGIGVRDSKALAERRARELAERIRDLAPHNIVRIGPAKYNELHRKMENLNRLLAWGHARVIENLLAEYDCPLAVSDQFGDERFLQSALMSKGRSISLIQRTGGEADLAVAAASILARVTFLNRINALSREVGVKLPRGALHVHGAARELYQRGGLDLLRTVAKLHFKTTKSVVSEQ
jgi:ribonuclease HIII